MCFTHQQHQSVWFPVLLLNVQSHLTDARLCGSQPYLIVVLSYLTDASLRDGLILQILLQQPYLLAVLSYLTDASLSDGLILLQQPYLHAVLSYLTDASLSDGLILLQQPYLLAVLSYLTDTSLRDGLVLCVLLQQPYLLAVLVHVVLHNRRQPHDAVPQLLALSSHQPLLFFFLKHMHTKSPPN